MRRFLFALAAMLPLAAPAGALADSAGRNVMAEAMARMMEAMGLFDDGDAAFNPMPYMVPGMGSVGGGQMPWAQMPWTPLLWNQMPGYGAFADRAGRFGLDGFGAQMPGAGSMPGWFPGGGATGLDGVWEGRDGGLLIVGGRRFRLQAARGGHLEGLIRRERDRLALYEPETDTVRAYEMAEQNGRLVLRDDAGNTFLYRRLWLHDDPFEGARFD